MSRRVLQPEQPVEPEIARAPARHHEFHDVEAFAAYIEREGTEGHCLVLADTDSREIIAVLDEGTEGDRESVHMKALVHPLFAPWAELLDKPIPVISFALFCMRHRRSILEPDGRELAMTMSQVKSSKTITTQTGVGKKSINGVVVELEIAGEKNSVPVELPEEITLTCPLFVGTDPVDIELDVLVTEGRDGIVVYLTAATVEELRIHAFEAMTAKLKSTGHLVGMGRIRTRDWLTIE